MTVSVIIPAYNEQDTVAQVICEINKYFKPGDQLSEIIVVSNGSTDETAAIASQFEDVTVIRHNKNMGKGAAIRSVLPYFGSDIIIIQDADLEYSPLDYKALLQPFERWNADVVYGSRFLGSPHRCMFFFHDLGNRFLTLLCNLFCNLNLSDMETGLKAFRVDLFRKINLQENRFGFEPEVTIKLARVKARFYEVPVSYNGRTYQEGKKIKWTDGVLAVWCIIKYGLLHSS